LFVIFVLKLLNEHKKFYKMHAKKITRSKTYLFLLPFFILITSCSVKNSTLKKGNEFEKNGNFKEASELYMNVLFRKNNIPEVQNALRRSAQLHISETAFSIANKNERNDLKGVVDDYYSLTQFVNRVNAFTKNIDIDSQTKAIYQKNLALYLNNEYDLANKYLSEEKFADAENTLKNIQKFDSNYKDTSKKLVTAVNEPLYLRGIEEFSNKKYIASYQTWNRIATKEPNYKDVKNKLQQALNERYKEGSYFLMQENFKEAEQAFYDVSQINNNYLDVRNLYKEAYSEPIYRKAVKDLKNDKCRTAYLGLEDIINKFNSYKNAEELKNTALKCAEYPIIIESYRTSSSNGFENRIQNAVIEDILGSKNPFVTIIKGGTSNNSPLYNINSTRPTNSQLSRYVNNSYANTRAKAILTVHINEYKLQENPPRVFNRNGVEVKRIKARNGSDSIVEKAVTYKEYERRNTLSSSITYSLIEIKTGKILMQKTIQKNDEQEVRYARYNSNNLSLIYPTRIIGSTFSRDDSNYKVLQSLFQTPEIIDNEQLSENILTDFRRRITNDVLVFNPEE
jgi:hypothetical protein